MMRDKKALKELLALDIERINSIAPKPFKPCFLSVILSILAPHYYTQEQLAQIKDYARQYADAVAAMETKDSMVVNAERSPQRRVTKKPRSKNTKRVATKRDLESVVVRKRARVSNKSRPSSSSSSSSSSSPPPPRHDLPIAFKNKIMELNGTDIKLIIHKTLRATDTASNNNCLSMPRKKQECDYLTEAEKKETKKRDDKNNVIGLDVTVFDPCLREWTDLKLKKWKMGEITSYNLAAGWNNLCRTNGLQVNDELDVWSFRVQGKLYFMLHKLAKNDNENLYKDEVCMHASFNYSWNVI